nr:AIG1-like protein [Tanacetum cinerariifolium]GFC03782.1 AIG1-like protein [Tanacetum cinerariifolium]
MSMKTYYPRRRVSLARTTEARLDDQAALMAGTSAGLQANKVVNDGDGEVIMLNWVQQAIDVESTSDNDARDQASEMEMKVLVDGKQDEAKVVKVVVWLISKSVTSQTCWK